MKLLSICIPTYNRNIELKILNENFLCKIIDKYEVDLEVIICDNSDRDIAVINEQSISKKIQYYWNEENLGFAGNVLKCYEKASSKFIWLLPDNDEIYTEEFFNLFDFLKQNQDNIGGVFIPNDSVNIFNEKTTAHMHKFNSLNELYSNEVTPFVLLSASIVKRDLNNFEEIKINFGNNDFVQIVLHSMALLNCNKIEYFPKPVINYCVEVVGRFNPLKTNQSLITALNYLKDYYPINIEKIKLTEYQGLLRASFLHDSGLYKIKDMEISRKQITSLAPRNKTLTLRLMELVFKFPKPIRSLIFTMKLIVSGTPSNYLIRYKHLRQRRKQLAKI